MRKLNSWTTNLKPINQQSLCIDLNKRCFQAITRKLFKRRGIVVGLFGCGVKLNGTRDWKEMAKPEVVWLNNKWLGICRLTLKIIPPQSYQSIWIYCKTQKLFRFHHRHRCSMHRWCALRATIKWKDGYFIMKYESEMWTEIETEKIQRILHVFLCKEN